MAPSPALIGTTDIAPAAHARPSDCARGATRTGWAIILLFFGGLGSWAAIAPLNAAVVGEGVVKVEGNRKSVQHLDGGTVKQILVQEGDKVRAGDVVMILDDTVVRTEVNLLEQQQSQLQAMEARLLAEISGASEIDFPKVLLEARDSLASAAMQDQIHEFASRREALAGRQAVLEQRIAQYDAQIAGNEAQKQPLEEQLVSVAAERESLEVLLKKGLITRTRFLELQRRESEFAGQKAKLDAGIGTSHDAIAELEEEIAQLRKEQSADVAAQLRDVRSKLSDISPRLEAASVALLRSDVRTPYTGTVVDLAVFSVGAVIGRGERLLDIVPEDTSLDIEAKIKVEEISDLKPGMVAEVRFTSYKQRVTPLIRGLIAEISADRLTDERTQVPYYIARIDVDEAELAANPEIQLYPGMPATVMITTEERTALDYIIGPLLVAFDRSFKER